MSALTEVEVHPVGDKPEGEGWLIVSTDHTDTIWKRTRFIKAASEWRA
jgi:hypothetical protein